MACLSVLVGFALLIFTLATGYGALAVLFWRRNTHQLAWAVALSAAAVSIVCLVVALPGSEVTYNFSYAALIKTILWSTTIGFGIGAAIATFIAVPILFFRSRILTRSLNTHPPIPSQHDEPAE